MKTLSCPNVGRSPTATPVNFRRPASPIRCRLEPSPILGPRRPNGNCPLMMPYRIALENARVIRVLSGTTAVSSGQTIYDPATIQTTIDQEQARFDPVLQQNNKWSRTNTPEAVPNFSDPILSQLTGTPVDAYLSTLNLTKTNVLGGQWALNWTENPRNFPAAASWQIPCCRVAASAQSPGPQ